MFRFKQLYGFPAFQHIIFRTPHGERKLNAIASISIEFVIVNFNLRKDYIFTLSLLGSHFNEVVLGAVRFGIIPQDNLYTFLVNQNRLHIDNVIIIEIIYVVT